MQAFDAMKALCSDSCSTKNWAVLDSREPAANIISDLRPIGITVITNHKVEVAEGAFQESTLYQVTGLWFQPCAQKGIGNWLESNME